MNICFTVFFFNFRINQYNVVIRDKTLLKNMENLFCKIFIRESYPSVLSSIIYFIFPSMIFHSKPIKTLKPERKYVNNLIPEFLVEYCSR